MGTVVLHVLLLYCFIAVLLYCCIAALLYCCIDRRCHFTPPMFSIGRTHATAWTSNGDLYVWGLNGHYQCGLQNAQDRRGDPTMDSEEHQEIRLQNGSLKGFVATRAQPHTSFVVEPALVRQC